MSQESTKFTEERYITSDPELMYNRYFASNVYRTYTEDFLDDDTGEVVSIERKELLFERGQHINGDAIAKVRFYLASGDIKEVDVSNQCRKGMYWRSSSTCPYIAKVNTTDKKYKILLYATGLQNVLDIIQDFGELQFAGGFNIATAKEIDYADIHIDSLQPIDLTTEYLKDKISMREWAAAEEAQQPAEQSSANKRFWRLDLEITQRFNTREDAFEHSYIIQTSSVERALAVIEVLLYQNQEKNIKEGDERASYTIKILSAAPMKIDYVVPLHFSVAHNQQTE